MFDWTERLTVALLIGFLLTLSLAIYADSGLLWLVWGALTVLITGTALVLVNRSEPPSDP
ncbi:hypothetical protein [Natrarchaeobaculum sulfurireducens]|uniref:Uncharacterized protein n=1 Tax=Natrarchaeobaculum sulfurireducens TaxID=2044521 RepID=A0A346PSD1_9EURY|nr:hypothetical protein [Natrarchaeobaculum sulfurireducens]AXR77596.1 hypothetical protein AArc1_1257 [Natrarchaeobaculum sulfurireducens]AXR82426.1 hypothetical protein AArcMg_2434 [Natrarchaeobaculum sulfurireducens]